MKKNLPSAIQAVLRSVLGPRGESDIHQRQAVHDFARHACGTETAPSAVPTTLAPFIEKLTHSPYKIVERDLDELRQAGYSEDQIFELTLAGALGAAAGRYQRTLELLEDENT